MIIYPIGSGAGIKYPVVRDGGTKETNPETTTVLADTGELDSGVYDIKVVVGASVASTFTIGVRNTANDGNVGDLHVVYVAAGQSAEFVIASVFIDLGERIRVLPEANITGTAAASVFVHRVG